MRLNKKVEIIEQNTEESHDQILNDIGYLQESIKETYHQLISGISNGTLSKDDEKILQDRIINYQAILVSLFKILDSNYNLYQNAITSTESTMKEQLFSIEIVNEELNNLAKKVKSLNEDNNSKLRMIEINRYYGEKYDDHATFMKHLVIFLLILLILYILKKKYLIPSNIYYILIFFVLLFGFIVLGRYFYRMVFRNNMNYEEYTFPLDDMIGVNSTNVPTIVSTLNPWLNTSSCNTTST
jgi:hypothetical protein